MHRQQEPRFDPVAVLPPELIHQIFMETVHWFDIKYGMEAYCNTSNPVADGALTLSCVSQKWRDVVFKDAHLWSQILVDTNDSESTDRLRLYLGLSQQTNLLVVLRGWKPVCGELLNLLMEASYRIVILVHPYDQPLIRLSDMSSTIHESPAPIGPFIELNVYGQSHGPRPPKSFFYPPSVHRLWLHGNCRYSTMSDLQSFQSLSELSIGILPPEGGAISSLQMPIVLPHLRTLTLVVRWWPGGHLRLSKLFSCPSLKALDLNVPLQIDQHSLSAFLVMLDDLTCFTHLKSLQFILHMILGDRKSSSIRNQSWLRESLGSDVHPLVPINLQSISLDVVRNRLKPIYASIWEEFEDVFMRKMQPLTDLITSQFRDVHLPCLRRLFLRGLPQEPPSITVTFPCLELLEVHPTLSDRFIILERIKAPNLQQLYISAPKYRGPCQETRFNCRGITSAKLLHISLQVDSEAQMLAFSLPASLSLAVRGWMELDILGPLPPWYSLEVGIVGSDYLLRRLDTLKAAAVTQLKDAFGGFIGSNVLILTRLNSLQKITLSGNARRISTPSSAHALLKCLAENVHLCPFLTSMTLAEYPSNWDSFFSALRIRNCAGLLDKRISVIRELEFLEGLHKNFVACLQASIQGQFVTLKRPPTRPGNAWPVRPITMTKDSYRSCYLCHISGFEPGCMYSETQAVDCGRERGQGLTIWAI